MILKFQHCTTIFTHRYEMPPILWRRVSNARYEVPAGNCAFVTVILPFVTVILSIVILSFCHSVTLFVVILSSLPVEAIAIDVLSIILIGSTLETRSITLVINTRKLM